MRTAPINTVKRNPSYLADPQSPYDRDVTSNAEYIKDSIDYNDNPLTSWLGKSSVEQSQIEQILRAYVQLVRSNYIPEYNPKIYNKQHIEMIGASAGQTSNLANRAMKILYWGVQQNRINTSRILYPKNIKDPNYRVPEEAGYFDRMTTFLAETSEGIVNRLGGLTTSILDTGQSVVNLGRNTSDGLGMVGQYGVPLALVSAASVIIYFGYNIAKTSSADHIVKAIPKVK